MTLMKMISFENGMHITYPGEEGRALVFASGLDPENEPSSFSLHGPAHKVMCLILDLIMIACREAEDKEMVRQFIQVLVDQLTKFLEEEKTNAEKD